MTRREGEQQPTRSELMYVITEMSHVLAMAARYAEGRHTGVIKDVRRAYRAWASLHAEPEPMPRFCNREDHDVLTGRFDSTYEAFRARHGDPS